MNKAVPWSVRGVDFDAREAAKEAARRSGMSLGEWLNSIIADQAAELGVEVDEIDESDRLEAVTARLAQMSKRPHVRSSRRDDGDRGEEFRSRRRPALVRDRYDSPDQGYDRPHPREYARERPAFRDPDLVLDEAIRAFERGSRRTGERTAAAITQVARRLEDIENHLGANHVETTANPSHEAIAKLEARLESLARRKEPDSTQSSLRELERKISEMADRRDEKSKPVNDGKADGATASAPDLARIEAKLNRLLDSATRSAAIAPASEPAFAHRGAPMARTSLGEAIAQISRRQHALDGGAPPAAAHAAPVFADAPRPFTDAPRQHFAAPQPPRFAQQPAPAPATHFAPAPQADISALQSEIAALSKRLDQSRLDAAARLDAVERTQESPLAPAPAPVFPDVEQLRRQIEGVSRALQTLAPRESLVSIESAIRDLGQRVDSSRQLGVREDILRPIEDLAADIRNSMSALSPTAGLQNLEREVRALVSKVDAAQGPTFDDTALRDIRAQTNEMRELLMRAVARPAPSEIIEKQIAGLSDRVEMLSQRGASASDDAAVIKGISEIRRSLDESLQSGVFRQLEDKIEKLGHKIDDAVAQSNATDQFDELAERIDSVQRSIAGRPGPVAAAPVDTSALERMMRELATKLERPAAADTGRLEEMVQSLAARLAVAGAPKSDIGLVEALQTQIAKLSEKVEAAWHSRSDTSVIEQLRDEMTRFNERMVAGPSRPDSQTTSTLQNQMSKLAARLDQGDASARVLTSLESTIGGLVRSVEELRTTAVGAAEVAARHAARETVAEAMQRQTPGVVAEPSEAITRDLADLRSMQDSADRRTHATLTAVHETLEKVVDRLAVLEDDLAEVRPEPLASGPAPVFARAPVASVETPPKFAPARAEPISAPPLQPQAQAGAAAPAMDFSLDELIEPGSGIPPGRRPAASMDAPASVTPEINRTAEQNSQSSFIAAARRAAAAASSGNGAAAKSSGRGKVGAAVEDALSSARDRAKAAHLALAGNAQDIPRDDAAGEPHASRFSAVTRLVSGRTRLIVIGLIGATALAGGLWSMRMWRSPTRAEVVDRTEQKTSQRATPESQNQTTASLPKSDADSSYTASLTKTPIDIAAATKFTPGPNAAAPVEVDASPVGSINARPAASSLAPTNLRDAAAAGNPAAQFELGARYADGRSVARDPRLAIQWFEKAALQNSAPAQYRLGSHYERGIGAERNLAKAREWYQRAAEAGNIRAMHNLAVLSAETTDGKPDYAAAASWFRKAAEYGVRDSQYNLAILYARGLGTEQNLQQSWVWFSLAAAQGDDDAAKKRDDVTGRLDATSLAAAKATYSAFKARPADKAANEVAGPAGGWDDTPRADVRSAPAPATSVKPAAKGKVTSL